MAYKSSMWFDSRACEKSWEEALKDHLKSVSNKTVHMKNRIRAIGILLAAEYIEYNQCVQLKELWNIYADACKTEFRQVNFEENKIPGLKYISNGARDFFCNNLPIVIVYQPSEKGPVSFVIRRLEGVQWQRLILELNWPVVNTNSIKSEIVKKVSSLIVPALGFATSDRDRDLLKFLLTKLTSATYLSRHCPSLKFSKKSLRINELKMEKSLDQFVELRQSSNTSYKCKKEKIELSRAGRMPGSGRVSFGEEFPDLASCMLMLFDSTGQGLQSHPRLICETLFVKKKSWLDMPRAVSILQQTFGIPILLSAAYTYTENYRSKSNQAKRHHEGMNINPDISLRKSTRDLNKHSSINSHYAMCDLQLALNEFCRTGGVIARDDKALVHTDVEVVQRPSKSWTRIRYSDHDWEKNCENTLQISTYQFVEVISEHSEVVSFIGTVGVTKTRVKGNGVSVVKMHYFEPSTAFRHMNELLFIASLDKHNHHFLQNGELVSKLLVTVDGGGDERPRNKITKFCSVLLRWLLNLDKYKCISLAEGQSKYHSVERLHCASNRALSMSGIIFSKMVHEFEKDDDGNFSMDKFRCNMEAAQIEAVNRLDGVPYSNNTLVSEIAPKISEWVFNPDYEAQIKQFLEKDTSAHHVKNNFVIKPNGPIWDRLCSLYSLTKEKAISAFHVNMYALDPKTSSNMHYAFATYRPDDEWRGEPIKRYEIQPVLNMARLPEFHYMSYDETVDAIETLESTTGDLPLWVTEKDFFLPTRNIKHLLENEPDMLQTELDNISNLIGVSTDDIQIYITETKEKARLKLKQKETVERFKDIFIGHMLVKDLKHLLHVKLGVPMHSRISGKADILVAIEAEVQSRKLSDKDLKQMATECCNISPQY
ncbi:hypothetical protein MAR_006146 [Mya arenaria]|uniref:Uncharacterized protein n=1 Tax=Mya arenaria TaxID=6604 RepID=A0ABY7DAC8_MYAAR|nr:hypothetical protein MAR_006146 [Mya arenaria]